MISYLCHAPVEGGPVAQYAIDGLFSACHGTRFPGLKVNQQPRTPFGMAAAVNKFSSENEWNEQRRKLIPKM